MANLTVNATNVMWALEDRGESTPADLTFDVGLAARTVRSKLDRLVDVGFVSTFEYANGTHYALSDEGHAWLEANPLTPVGV